MEKRESFLPMHTAETLVAVLGVPLVQLLRFVCSLEAFLDRLTDPIGLSIDRQLAFCVYVCVDVAAAQSLARRSVVFFRLERPSAGGGGVTDV